MIMAISPVRFGLLVPLTSKSKTPGAGASHDEPYRYTVSEHYGISVSGKSLIKKIKDLRSRVKEASKKLSSVAPGALFQVSRGMPPEIVAKIETERAQYVRENNDVISQAHATWCQATSALNNAYAEVTEGWVTTNKLNIKKGIPPLNEQGQFVVPESVGLIKISKN